MLPIDEAKDKHRLFGHIILCNKRNLLQPKPFDISIWMETECIISYIKNLADEKLLMWLSPRYKI